MRKEWIRNEACVKEAGQGPTIDAKGYLYVQSVPKRFWRGKE